MTELDCGGQWHFSKDLPELGGGGGGGNSTVCQMLEVQTVPVPPPHF